MSEIEVHVLCWEPKGDLGGNGPVLGRNVCGATSPYHGTLTVLALHPCRSSLAMGQPWGAQWLCGCKTPVPSSVQARGACSPWLVATSPAGGLMRKAPAPLASQQAGAPPGPTRPGCYLHSAILLGAHLLLPLTVSGAVASICLLQSQVPLVPPCPPLGLTV